jgi:hypothetical protein
MEYVPPFHTPAYRKLVVIRSANERKQTPMSSNFVTEQVLPFRFLEFRASTLLLCGDDDGGVMGLLMIISMNTSSELTTDSR